jgi:hypothetical protein
VDRLIKGNRCEQKKKRKRLAATRIHGLHFPQGGVNVEKRRDEKLRKPDSRVSILGKKRPLPTKN